MLQHSATMRIRRSPLGRGAAASLAFAVAVGLVSPPAHALAPESGDFEQRIADADGHADAGEHADAVEDYVGAFEAMPDELKVTEVGEFVVLAAGKAALADFEARQDPKSLKKARDLLEGFIEMAAGVDVSVDAVSARLDEVQAAIPADEPIVGPEPEPEVDEDPDPVVDTPDKPPRRGLAIGLLAGGGVALLAGVGLMIAGARQVPWYEQKLADEGWTPDQVGYDREIASAERIRTIDYAVGGVFLGVGAGLAAAGAVLLVKSGRKSSGQAAIAPSLRADGGGLTMRLRF